MTAPLFPQPVGPGGYALPGATPAEALPARPAAPEQNTLALAQQHPLVTPWQRIQNLPLVGRGAADRFRSDLGQTWQAIKERLQGYGAPTGVPWLGLASGLASLTGAGGPEARAAEELSPEASRFLIELEGAAKTGAKLRPFAILSADRPGLPPEVLAERRAVLKDLVRGHGVEPIEVDGVFEGNSERSILAPGLGAPQARHLGERFGQDAVITHDAYHDLKTGQSFPLTGHGEASAAEPHTLLPSGKRFGMRFDFNHPEQTGTPAAVAALRKLQPPEREPMGDLPMTAGAAAARGDVLPQKGQPTVLGASEPKYAYRYTGGEPKPGPTLSPGGILSTETPPPPGTRHGLPLADEDIRTLGVAGRYLLQKYPDRGSWVRAMQAEHPNFAPHLEGYAGERAWQVAKRAKLPPLPSQQQVEHLARSPEGESTRPWYHTWWPEVKNAFGEEDGEMLTRFHAVLSAQAEATERNPLLSLQALHDYKAGDRAFPHVPTTADRRASLQALMDAGPRGTAPMAVEGRKVNNFYLALRGHPEAVTLDSHMAQTYLGKQKLSPEEYDALDARVRADAREAGVSPRDYQAMIWGGQTRYPFSPPEHGVWNQLLGRASPARQIGDDVRQSLLERFPRANAAAQRHALRRMVTDAPQAPSHAAVQVGTETFEVPMARGHAGALERAIEEMRGLPGYATADDVMAGARDGYTMGDGRFIPRERLENLHSSDFIRGRRAHPDDAE